jgi:AcrR family transcriptional regulator
VAQNKYRRKPTQERAVATVEAILEATARILVEDGYAQASTNRIAKRAGVSIGSLYHYFPDKDTIIDALVERVSARQLQGLSVSLAVHADMALEPGVRGLIQAALDSQKIEAELAHVLITQCPRDGRLDLDRRWKQRMTELLAAQMITGAHPVRPRNIELAAYVLVRALFAVVRDAIAERPELLTSDALTHELTELVVRYLRPEEA